PAVGSSLPQWFQAGQSLRLSGDWRGLRCRHRWPRGRRTGGGKDAAPFRIRNSCLFDLIVIVLRFSPHYALWSPVACYRFASGSLLPWLDPTLDTVPFYRDVSYSSRAASCPGLNR